MRILLLFFTLSLGVWACSKEAPSTKRPPQQHLVEVINTEQSNVAITRERTGTLRAFKEIQIYNQEEGRITELSAYEGDNVNKGDVIAHLDDRLLQAELARTKALRIKAEKDFKRTSGLVSKQLASQSELTSLETQLAVTKADEQILLTRLGYTTLRSPIDGVITARLSEPGNIAERYSHLLTISDLSALITDVTVSELLINKLTEGDSVAVSIDALEQQEPVMGVINRIHPNLDPITRTGLVEIVLNPAPQGTRPGQLARVLLKTQQANRLLVPFSSLRRDSQGEYLFVVEEGKAKRIAVNSGLRIGNSVEILKGLSPNQSVVIRGFNNLRDDKAVNIVGEGG